MAEALGTQGTDALAGLLDTCLGTWPQVAHATYASALTQMEYGGYGRQSGATTGGELGGIRQGRAKAGGQRLPGKGKGWCTPGEWPPEAHGCSTTERIGGSGGGPGSPDADGK